MTNDELASHKKLQADVAGLIKLFAIQQQALENLALLVDAHQRLFEAQVGYVPPNPTTATSN